MFTNGLAVVLIWKSKMEMDKLDTISMLPFVKWVSNADSGPANLVNKLNLMF